MSDLAQTRTNDLIDEIAALLQAGWRQHHELPLHAPMDGFLAVPQYYVELADKIVNLALQDPEVCRTVLQKYLPYIETSSTIRSRQRRDTEGGKAA